MYNLARVHEMWIRFRSGLRLATREAKVEEVEMGASEKEGDLVGGLQQPPAQNPMRQTTRPFFFDALNGSSYPITSIQPSTRPPSPPPPPVSPPTSTSRASSSKTPSPSMPPAATPSFSSTAPPASSSAPSAPPPTTLLAAPSPFAVPSSSSAPPPPMPSRPTVSYCNFVNPDVVGMPMATNDDAASNGVVGQQLGEGEGKVGAAVKEEFGRGQGQTRMSWRSITMRLAVALGDGGQERERGRSGQDGGGGRCEKKRGRREAEDSGENGKGGRGKGHWIQNGVRSG